MPLPSPFEMPGVPILPNAPITSVSAAEVGVLAPQPAVLEPSRSSVSPSPCFEKPSDGILGSLTRVLWWSAF